MQDPSESMVAVAYATTVLALFMWLCGTITTYVRGKSMESPNGEDGPVMTFFNRAFFVPVKDLVTLQNNVENDVVVNRWLRITANNTANIPAALLVFLVVAHLGSLSADILIPLVWIFVAARFAHTIFYATSIQPFRTASYSIGAICMMIGAASVLVAG